MKGDDRLIDQAFADALAAPLAAALDRTFLGGTYPNVERGELAEWAADVEQESAYASREWIARRVRGYRLAAEILDARDAAHAKHGDDSIEGMDGRDPRWLAVLVEEVGEVAHALTYDSGATDEDLEGELVDVLAVASAWLDAVRTRRVAAGMAAADAEAAGDTRPTS